MVPLIGYIDRLSARPGEQIAVKVSSQLDQPYRADLVRIIHGDPNPAGPGIKLEEIPAGFAGTYDSRFQPIYSGSCGVVTPANLVAFPDPCTIVLRVQPWLLDGHPQTVLAIDGGPALSVAAEGASLELGGDRVHVAAPMLKRPDGLSVNWCEYFQKPTWIEAIAPLREILLNKGRSVGGESRFALLNVDSAKKTTSKYVIISIVLDEKDDDPSHSLIKGYDAYNQEVAEELAKVVIATYSARA
jgi:hypothetical protein